jgi:hypothetical protein
LFRNIRFEENDDMNRSFAIFAVVAVAFMVIVVGLGRTGNFDMEKAGQATGSTRR